MSGHTPGPWEVRNTGRMGVWKRAGDSWVKVASVEAPDAIRPQWNEKREANARLIAAAPELLDAAEGARSELRARASEAHIDIGDEERAWLNAMADGLYNAIAKATDGGTGG